MEFDQSLYFALSALVASVFGSMLGLGGGVFIIPLFTLLLGVDPKVAIAASAVCVVANSVIGSLRHVSNGYVNIRLAMLLEVTTAIGAIIGAIIAVRIDADVLRGLMGVLLLYAAYSMARGNKSATAGSDDEPLPDPYGMEWQYSDHGSAVRYVPQKLQAGIGAGTIAGVLSGMLGIGGGLVKVPVMNLVMKIPLRAAAGTSSFMVGMTAAASALVFYSAGHMDPNVTAPALVGTLCGSTLGSTLTKKFHVGHLLSIFVVIMLVLGINMILSAFGINLI